jgi:hypothetical protein
MFSIALAVLALIGAAVQVSREPKPRSRARVAEVYLLWWLVVAIGVGGIVSAAVHVFDGPATAEDIGFTRGDGGFQFENAMGDLALGVVSIMCLRFRGNFWIAALTFVTIQYGGDAYGHFYQWIENDNTEPGNIGPPLWLDIILPAVGWVMFAIFKRAGGVHAVDEDAGKVAPATSPGSAR